MGVEVRSFKEFQDRVYDFILAATGLDPYNIQLANTDEPAPDDLYATFLIFNDEEHGHKDKAYFRDDDDQLFENAIGSYRAQVSLQFFRAGAFNMAHAFRAYCNTSAGLESALTIGLSVQKYGLIRRLDAIISETPEERAGLDLTIDYRYATRQNVEHIERIPFAVRSADGNTSREIENGS